MVTRGAKEAVVLRARGCCEYCRSQMRYATEAFSIEHIQPLSREGSDDIDNLALSCQGCNGYKYNKMRGVDPVTGESHPLFHPRRQRWPEHFIWGQDCTLIVGLTPTGRATIDALRLNREPLVNLRRLLFWAGEHPPPEDGS